MFSEFNLYTADMIQVPKVRAPTQKVVKAPVQPCSPDEFLVGACIWIKTGDWVEVDALKGVVTVTRSD